MITGISEFGFFCPKMAVSWRITSFQKIGWNPYFYSVFGCAKKKKILIDNWKALFLVFFVFFTFSFSVLFFFGFFVLFFVLFFCFFVFCFFGGFKGQVRWPKGPPHLALNPPYFFVFVFLLFFCVFLEAFCFFWFLFFFFALLSLF